MKRNTGLNIAAVFCFLTMPVCAQESSGTDDVIAKAADATVFTMTQNLKLTQDQVDLVKPIIVEELTKEQDLEQSLQNGTLDAKSMYDQREQLRQDEDSQLGQFLSADQIKLWMNLQNEPSSHSHSRHASTA